MLQQLLISLAQVKASNTSIRKIIKIIDKSYILCTEKKKLLKRYIEI